MQLAITNTADEVSRAKRKANWFRWNEFNTAICIANYVNWLSTAESSLTGRRPTQSDPENVFQSSN
jgi:hypothetical protein